MTSTIYTSINCQQYRGLFIQSTMRQQPYIYRKPSTMPVQK